ncbi:MAG: fumarylacetoacetate hydrolase family protein [Gammaproteobacteria bacterium]|nr:fumarylacetoacetate hydrolase family protein [Gammaproteobacteria bacterium]
MKLLRYGSLGKEKPGLLDKNGIIRDLSNIIQDVSPKQLAQPDFLKSLKSLDVNALDVIDSDTRMGAAVAGPGKIVCVGFNSALHTEQLGMRPFPKKDMLLFMKPSSSVCGPNDPILHTRMTQKLDWEAELAIVIGKQGKYIPKHKARDFILGYTCMNDLSERFLQFEVGDSQFTKGKCFDNAAPLGPYLVTKDEVGDANQLDVNLWVNQELRQTFNTRHYIHDDISVVSYISQYFTLYPGDIISMGSAPGNAQYWGVEHFLKPGDEVVLSISNLGTQSQVVITEP